MKYGLICLVVLCVVSPLSAQQVGDTVIVVAASEAKLKRETRLVGVVPRGATLTVEEASASGFQTRWLGVTGWVAKEDVLPLDKGIVVFRKAIKNKPHACDYYALGNADSVKTNYDAAVADYTEAIRLDPKYAEAYRRRGDAWCWKDDHDKAIDDYREAIRLDPKNASAFSGRGGSYYAKGDLDHAIADCTESIRLNPNLGFGFYYRGAARFMKGDYAKAVSDYTETLRIDHDYAETLCARGMAYRRMGDLDRAIADCSQAIRLNDAYDDAYYERGWAYNEKGDYIRAINDYTEVIRIKPKRGDAYFRRGRVRHAQGDYKKAIADFTEAIRLDPKDGDRYASRGWACHKKGDCDLAIYDYTTAITLSPEWPSLFETRGVLLIARGDYDLGIRDIQKAIQLNPKDQAAKFEAWPKSPLSADAMRHGERQLRHMLNDRKAMEKHGKLAEPLYQWAIRKFAGEDLGEPVFWSAQNPTPHFNAQYHPPTDEQPGSILVREEHGDGPELGKRSFEELWSNAVFELYNIAKAKDFDRLERRVHSGELSRVQYATEMIRVESQAAEKTRSFYIHVFLPWAKQHKIATDPLLWFLAEKSDPSQTLVLDRVDKTDRYWLGYEDWYDDIRARAKAHKQEVKEEIEYLAKQAAAKQQKTAKGDGAAASSAKANAKDEPSAASNRIEPLDVLTVWGRGTLLDQPLQKCFLVEPGGGVSLGPCYGRVVVKGMTVQEAEAAITKHLNEILVAPEVEVVAAGRATRWPGETPKAPYHIRPNELLKIAVVGTFLDHPINGDFRVDAQGKVDLGEPYGDVAVKGLTLEEAEQAITKNLMQILNHPEVSVTLAGWKRE